MALKKRTIFIIVSFLFSVFYFVYLYPVIVSIYINAEYGNIMSQLIVPFQNGFFSTMLIAVLFSLGHTILIVIGILCHFLSVIFRGRVGLFLAILLYFFAGLGFQLSFIGLIPLIVLTGIPLFKSN